MNKNVTIKEKRMTSENLIEIARLGFELKKLQMDHQNNCELIKLKSSDQITNAQLIANYRFALENGTPTEKENLTIGFLKSLGCLEGSE